jgi:hypothetical protein
MPFSAATGLAEAARAIGTAANNQAQTINAQAVVITAKTMANAPDRLFSASLETRKNMRNLLFQPSTDDL